ncbi:MAG: hypothetical protein AMXMBFR84_50420 [Candidatus Hydrogenedentota bacterium]
MAAPKRAYDRLPGRSRRMAALWTAESNQLYLADDHLVHVYKSNRYQETYKRFEYRDIQAIILRKTVAGTYMSATFGTLAIGLLALGGLLGAGQNWEPGFYAFLVGAGLVAAVATGIHAAFGPTCVCSLVTPVQIEDLPSLGRWRSARSAVRLIKDRIQAVQEADSEPHSEALRQRVSTWLSEKTRKLRHETGYWHLLLYTYSLFNAALCAILVASTFAGAGAVHVLAIFGMMVLIVGSLVRQSNTDLPPALRSMTSLYALIMSLLVFFSIFFNFVFLAEDELRNDDVAIGMFRVINAATMAVNLLFAVPGLLILRSHWIAIGQVRADREQPVQAAESA